MMVLEEIRNDRNGKPSRLVIDDLEDSKEFWDFFGGRPDKIPDHPVSENKPQPRVIIQVSDESGKLEFTEVQRGEISLDALKSEDVFIVDVGLSVYVWIGKGCTKQEKREGMKYAVKHVTDSGRPATIPICRVIEGKEPAHFFEQFN